MTIATRWGKTTLLLLLCCMLLPVSFAENTAANSGIRVILLGFDAPEILYQFQGESYLECAQEWIDSAVAVVSWDETWEELPFENDNAVNWLVVYGIVAVKNMDLLHSALGNGSRIYLANGAILPKTTGTDAKENTSIWANEMIQLARNGSDVMILLSSNEKAAGYGINIDAFEIVKSCMDWRAYDMYFFATGVDNYYGSVQMATGTNSNLLTGLEGYSIIQTVRHAVKNPTSTGQLNR